MKAAATAGLLAAMCWLPMCAWPGEGFGHGEQGVFAHSMGAAARVEVKSVVVRHTAYRRQLGGMGC